MISLPILSRKCLIIWQISNGKRIVITKDIPAWTVCAGHPCKPIKERVLRPDGEETGEKLKGDAAGGAVIRYSLFGPPQAVFPSCPFEFFVVQGIPCIGVTLLRASRALREANSAFSPLSRGSDTVTRWTHVLRFGSAVAVGLSAAVDGVYRTG